MLVPPLVSVFVVVGNVIARAWSKRGGVEAKETLFEQGDDATHGYVVGWGQIRLDQVTPDGQNVVLRHMGPGEMIGIVAVFRRIPFPATPVVLEALDEHGRQLGRSSLSTGLDDVEGLLQQLADA